ncbi:YncE family protein [Undibacterium sp. Tian12W]|uniref:YncE family protein n=1 Tax=Undibacterium sp. Tian12W TaxID=3413054 RepID=UPI003BF04E01
MKISILLTSWGLFFGLSICQNVKANDKNESLCLAINSNIEAIRITPDGSKAFITDSGIGRVIVVSTRSDTILADIPVSGKTMAIGFSPDSKKAYITSSNGSSHVNVFDVSSHALIQSFSFPNDVDDLEQLIVSKDGRRLYAPMPNATPASILVMDTATGGVSSIPVIGLKNGIAISPSDSLGYTISEKIAVIDTALNVIRARLPLPGQASDFTSDIAVSVDGSILALGKIGHPAEIFLMNLKDGNKINSIYLGSEKSTKKNPNGLLFPGGLTFSPDGKKLFVSHNFTQPGRVSVIDIKKRSIVASIILGNFPSGIAITRDGKKAYVLVHEEGGANIAVIDTRTNGMLAKISVQIPAGSQLEQKKGICKSK